MSTSGHLCEHAKQLNSSSVVNKVRKPRFRIAFHTPTAKLGKQGEGMVSIGLTGPVLHCSIVIVGRIFWVILGRSLQVRLQEKSSIRHFDK